jgi:hypothetical protein
MYDWKTTKFLLSSLVWSRIEELGDSIFVSWEVAKKLLIAGLVVYFLGEAPDLLQWKTKTGSEFPPGLPVRSHP